MLIDYHLRPGTITLFPWQPPSRLGYFFPYSSKWPVFSLLLQSLPPPVFLFPGNTHLLSLFRLPLPHGVHWADSSLGFILSFSLLCPWSAIMEAHHGSKSNELAVSIGRNPFLAFSNTSSPYRGQNLTLPLYMFAFCLYPIWALPCQEYHYILFTRDRRLKSTCKESQVPF